MLTLKGRPVAEIEQASTLSSVEDIVLADLSQYVLIDGGLNTAVSIDAYFVSDQAAFRFVLRVDGQPAWASPITAYNGSGQRSPFVTLAAHT
jgi:HK97 family phage major capsid protein